MKLAHHDEIWKKYDYSVFQEHVNFNRKLDIEIPEDFEIVNIYGCGLNTCCNLFLVNTLKKGILNITELYDNRDNCD